MIFSLRIAAFVTLALSAAFAGPLPLAQPEGLSAPISNLGGGQAPWTILVLLTLLALIPALLLSMTPFVRLLIVFHFLRQALGTQSTQIGRAHV